MITNPCSALPVARLFNSGESVECVQVLSISSTTLMAMSRLSTTDVVYPILFVQNRLFVTCASAPLTLLSMLRLRLGNNRTETFAKRKLVQILAVIINISTKNSLSLLTMKGLLDWLSTRALANFEKRSENAMCTNIRRISVLLVESDIFITYLNENRKIISEIMFNFDRFGR